MARKGKERQKGKKQDRKQERTVKNQRTKYRKKGFENRNFF